MKKPAIEFKNHYNHFFFENKYIFIAPPLSTNIVLIHKGISKTKCNISRLEDLSKSSLILYLNNDALYWGFALFSAIFNLHYTRDHTN